MEFCFSELREEFLGNLNALVTLRSLGMHKIFLFAVLFSISACSSTKAEPNSQTTGNMDSEAVAAASQASELIGSWSHLRGRDMDNVQIWVRKQKLPPARFRGAMIFKANGNFKVRILHPSDAHYYARGRYVVTNNTLELRYTKTHNGEEVVTKRYEVHIEGNEMQLRR
jgi:hypothetical protein